MLSILCGLLVLGLPNIIYSLSTITSASSVVTSNPALASESTSLPGREVNFSLNAQSPASSNFTIFSGNASSFFVPEHWPRKSFGHFTSLLRSRAGSSTVRIGDAQLAVAPYALVFHGNIKYITEWYLMEERKNRFGRRYNETLIGGRRRENPTWRQGELHFFIKPPAVVFLTVYYELTSDVNLPLWIYVSWDLYSSVGFQFARLGE